MIELFKDSLFFRTLIFNSMMSLTKSFFELTSYMKSDKEYGLFWKLIYKEFLLTKKMLLEITLLDKARNQNFKKYLDKRLVKWLTK